MTKPQPWTRHEIRKLTKLYEEGGTRHAQEQLPNRTKKAIKVKATKLMLQSGIPQGHIHAKHVLHQRNKKQGISQYLLTKAKQDGVLHYNPNTWIKYTVPIEWADKFNQQFQQTWNDYQQTINWLTTQDIANALNYNRSYIARAFTNNERLAQELHAHIQIKRINYPNTHLKFHPQQAHAFTKKYVEHMTCPNCKHKKTHVITTRPGGTKQHPDPTETKRLRHCRKCNHRFHTTELPTKALTHQLMNLK